MQKAARSVVYLFILCVYWFVYLFFSKCLIPQFFPPLNVPVGRKKHFSSFWNLFTAICGFSIDAFSRNNLIIIAFTIHCLPSPVWITSHVDALNKDRCCHIPGESLDTLHWHAPDEAALTDCSLLWQEQKERLFNKQVLFCCFLKKKFSRFYQGKREK